MGDEMRGLEDAKSEALAAFAAIASIIDLGDKPLTIELGSTVNSLRDDAVRHLSVALNILGRGEGGNS